VVYDVERRAGLAQRQVITTVYYRRVASGHKLRQYLDYSAVDFWGFRPTGTTWCTSEGNYLVSTHGRLVHGIFQPVGAWWEFGISKKFMKFRNINASHGHTPYAIVTKLSGLVGQFHSRLLFQIWGFVVGVPLLWGSTLGVWGWVIPDILSAPNGGETICRIRKSLKVQKWYGSSLISITVLSMAGFGLRAPLGEVKKFDVFVCPSCFWMVEFVNARSPSNRLKPETILIFLDRERFAVVCLCSTLSLSS